MQTAVQKLEQQLKDVLGDMFTDFALEQEFKQAKEIEKRQHELTWFDSTLQFDNSAEMTNAKSFNDYYNKIYKNNI